jgi:hypothetical protein
MTYTGKLYGRQGGTCIETGWHSSDVDKLTAAVKRLEAENAQLTQAIKTASHISCEKKALIEELKALCDEARTAKRDLIPALDPDGYARMAFGAVADRITKMLEAQNAS